MTGELVFENVKFFKKFYKKYCKKKGNVLLWIRSGTKWYKVVEKRNEVEFDC